MKSLIYVVLFDVNLLDRKLAEQVEGTTIDVFHASGCKFGAREPIMLSIAERFKISTGTSGLNVMTLSDFMDTFNDEKIGGYGKWLSYVYVDIETQQDRDNADHEFNQFVFELRGLCDDWGYPHMTAEQEREAFEVYKSVQESDPTGSHVWVEDALYTIYDDSTDKMRTIEYDGLKYPTRTFSVIIPDEGKREIRISVDSLTDAFGEKHLEWDTPERHIDDTIYFYVENGVIGLRPEVICENYLDVPMTFIEEIK